MMKEGQVRIPSGCAIAAVISRDGNRMTGEMITRAMKPMHDRSNGLGGGFAGYGIYPDYKDFYAFHLFFDSRDTRKQCETFLKEYFEIVHAERIPTRKIPEITDEPMIWRYFVDPARRERIRIACGDAHKHRDGRGLCVLQRKEHGHIQGGRLSGGCQQVLQAG